MKILILSHGGLNEKDRIREIENLGHDVMWEMVYPDCPTLVDKIAIRAAAHFKVGPWIKKINSTLLDGSLKWSGFDLIWITKGLYIYDSTIEQLRKRANCPVIQFTPDIALKIKGTQKSSVFVKAIPKYDAIITTKDFEIKEYWSLGARQVFYFEQAVSHRRLYPRDNLAQTRLTDVGFIGHEERHYKSLLRSLSTAGLHVTVHGPGWEKWRNQFAPSNRGIFMGPAVIGEAYAQHLSGMCIGLGLLTKLGPEVVTTRSHEIPACGTFLLAERTEKHQELYKEGVEAEFFEGDEELVDKTKYYFAHAKSRESIAKAGLERFLQSNCRLDRQMAIILEQLRVQFGLPE